MNIELKKVQFSEHLSEETNAFTANLYVDGKHLGYIRNDGRGGNTDVYHNKPEHKEKFREVEEYCKTLPPRTYTFNGQEHSFDMNLENFVDELFEHWLKRKENKKKERKMKTNLMWGVPNGHSYKTVNFKRPLTEIPHNVLQQQINRWKETFEDGEVFFNTNLNDFEL